MDMHGCVHYLYDWLSVQKQQSGSPHALTEYEIVIGNLYICEDTDLHVYIQARPIYHHPSARVETGERSSLVSPARRAGGRPTGATQPITRYVTRGLDDDGGVVWTLR
jgi:hypothetical protein